MKASVPHKRRAAWRRGIWAERICAGWLMCKGYRILGVRVRTVLGEIDLLASRGDTLAVIEVKARGQHVLALDSVGIHKRRRLEAAARTLQSGKIAGLVLPANPNIRFDVMAVCPWRMPLHVPDAWRPDA